MSLSTNDYDEYVVRKMMEQELEMTKNNCVRFLSLTPIPGDESIVASYLQSERDSESGGHSAEVQDNLSILRNEVTSED